jgi:geranylgeranyl pyrophosphate synthase
MSRTWYRELAHKISRDVDVCIENMLDISLHEPLNSMVRLLPERRKGRSRLRDLLLFSSYKIAEGNEWEHIAPVAAAIELYNCSTYIINWFLDGKGELQTWDDERTAVNAGFMLREIAQQHLHHPDVIQGLSHVNACIYQSQNMDLFELTVENYRQYQDPARFFPALYEKGRLACGYFSAWITSAASILASNRKYEQIFRSFALDLSTGIQLANDAGDFILPSSKRQTPEKSYKDQLTDIKNGRLTLCVWYGLQHGEHDSLLPLVGKQYPSYEEQKQAVDALHRCGAFTYVRKEASKLMKRCKRTLHALPKSQYRDILSTMSSIIRTNKFYAALRRTD